jgi:predicted transposase YdaD
LDLTSFRLENCTYINNKLQESISDLVFDCRYKANYSGGKTHAKVVLLIEHQSTADRFMPLRVYHYLFNMLHKKLREQAKDPLPAVYALVFYHGKQSPYPYSMGLEDCFDDPLGIMNDMFTQPVHLIDVNQISDDQLKQQRLLGIMTGC